MKYNIQFKDEDGTVYTATFGCNLDEAVRLVKAYGFETHYVTPQVDEWFGLAPSDENGHCSKEVRFVEEVNA